MNHQRLQLTIILASVLCTPPLTHAADLFSLPQQKAGFLKALQQKDPQYDPAEKMLRARFSSPGYHTTLKAGYVHRTRDSLSYAVALLDTGKPERLKRAQDILRRLIALQDQKPKSRTYGIWSWFLEEPLDKMSPPDWNWADFCGTQLHRLPDDLQEKVRQSIIHASYSIKRRNVGPGYTNIALMGTYVTHVAGELFDVPELTEYAHRICKGPPEALLRPHPRPRLVLRVQQPHLHRRRNKRNLANAPARQRPRLAKAHPKAKPPRLAPSRSPFSPPHSPVVRPAQPMLPNTARQKHTRLHPARNGRQSQLRTRKRNGSQSRCPSAPRQVPEGPLPLFYRPAFTPAGN
ncbi:MAG: hypothetical protein ACYSW3_11850 [Planctomycetota bacterium]